MQMQAMQIIGDCIKPYLLSDVPVKESGASHVGFGDMNVDIHNIYSSFQSVGTSVAFL